MRIRERIPNFIDSLNTEVIHKIFLNWFKINFEETELQIIKDKRKIKKYWMADHDLRFSQVLVNMGYINNIPGWWYYIEDDDTLLDAGCEPRDVLFWGQHYDKDMNRLPEIKWLLIKNMTTDHINAVIAFMGEKLPERYKKVFQDELVLRKT